MNHGQQSQELCYVVAHKGICNLILDVMERKLSLKHNDEEEYTIANDIDFTNNKFNMAVSVPLYAAKKIELIAFKIIQSSFFRLCLRISHIH